MESIVPPRALLVALVLVLSSIALSACSGRHGTRAPFYEYTANSSPELIECVGYRQPDGSQGSWTSVWLQFFVNAEGVVDPGTVTVVRHSTRDPAQQARLTTLAAAAARGCSFVPAHRDGEAVPAIVRHRFRFTT